MECTLVAREETGAWLLVRHGEAYYFLRAGCELNHGTVFVETQTGATPGRPGLDAKLTQSHLELILRSLALGELRRDQAHLLAENCSEHRGSYSLRIIEPSNAVAFRAQASYFLPSELEPLVRSLLVKTESLCDH